MQQQIDIKTQTIEQLKAIAYDLLSNIQDLQNKLQMINNEINLKNQVSSNVIKNDERKSS